MKNILIVNIKIELEKFNELKKLNDKYKQEIRELKEKLNDKDISLNEYKEELNILNDRHEQELQKLKQEYINSNTKDKTKLLEKINELNRLNNEYIKEKQNNIREINDLKLQNKLLKEGLDNSRKSNDLKTKENNKLINEIEKLKLAREKSTLLKIIQDARKKDDRARTFAPPDNNDRLNNLIKTSLIPLKENKYPKENIYLVIKNNLKR